MPWEVARGALDLFLAQGGGQGLIEFNGGEPLLAFELLRRCLGHLAARVPPGATKFCLTTNGTLLTPEMGKFLAARDVELQVSLHGEDRALDARGERASPDPEEALATLRRGHRRYYIGRVRVRAAVTPSSIGTLAPSCRRLVERGAPLVEHYAVFGLPEPPFQKVLASLSTQMEQMLADSLEHWERTGQIPVAFLRSKPVETPTLLTDGPCCGASSAGGMCVDTGGRIWTCPFFASSLVRVHGLTREVSEAVSLGLLGDGRLEARVAALPERTARVRVLNGRAGKHSPHGRCASCEALSECSYCPASTVQIPGNSDPELVPALACAFSLASFRARRAFQREIGGRAPAVSLRKVRSALERLGAALSATPHAPAVS